MVHFGKTEWSDTGLHRRRVTEPPYPMRKAVRCVMNPVSCNWDPNIHGGFTVINQPISVTRDGHGSVIRFIIITLIIIRMKPFAIAIINRPTITSPGCCTANGLSNCFWCESGKNLPNNGGFKCCRLTSVVLTLIHIGFFRVTL